ncbi:alkaline phosphatase PafA [Spirosoma endophyticum]|uniref:Type I phosphodiesterase / nucleotide pyrophosphatase n=1 Tax=Spirosoma endophyticum TaxID=662367 RepID=A0A1I1L4I1_9BACT|nr:alkaline phosphatase PafA [Spirosoma endophyticum]SFC67901.1 Type I phosphodiesterase / nucleotide pyrophosphatase [Spirosoma endophyticum]
MRLFSPFILIALLTTSVIAQPKKSTVTIPASGNGQRLARPKLVVGIVVDQMRYDYLYRYYDKFGTGGFRRMMDGGFNARNNHYHYAATYTGPGHAAVYTGSAPALNGIVGNDFYERNLGRLMYCAEDTSVSTVGNTGTAGKMSPRNLLVTTIGDQLKLATDGRAKVVGIALKDRGAILPAGHTANAAYWFDSKDGNFISSTFYQKELPQWVQAFNARKLPEQFITQKWEPTLAANQYAESTPDDEPYEASMAGEDKPVFPHSFAVQAGGLKYEPLRTSPYGDQITKEFALAAIKGEQLGQHDVTDMLCLSFSSPDYIGHAFGTHAVETEDNYIRLDRQLADIFAQLDATVGKGQWLAFLSADHGAVDAPGFLQMNRIPAGTRGYGDISDLVKSTLEKAYGPGQWVLSYINQQIYLNHTLLTEKKIAMQDVYELLRTVLLKQKAIVNVINLHNLGAEALPELQANLFRNVNHPNRSGDFYVMQPPGWIEGRSKGTTHGTVYAYDTHVPFLLYGWGIKPGQTLRRTHVHDIAPTITALLSLLEPSGCIGNPVEEAISK